MLIVNYYAIPTIFKQLVITISANSFSYTIVGLMALNLYNLISTPFPHPLFAIYVEDKCCQGILNLKNASTASSRVDDSINSTC